MLALSTAVDRNAWGGALLASRLAKLEPKTPAPARAPGAPSETEEELRGAASSDAGVAGKAKAEEKEAPALPPDVAAMFAEQRRKFLEEQVE